MSIQPHETATVQIPLRASTRAFWDEKPARLRVESEPVSIMVGASSKEIKLSTTLHVE